MSSEELEDLARQAQDLLWVIEASRRIGSGRQVDRLRREMAGLHERIAKARLQSRDSGGLVDLFAAVHAFGEAGSRRAAVALLELALDYAEKLSGPSRENVVAQVEENRVWLDGLRVLPSLSDYAVAHRPPLPKLAAA